MPRWIALVAIVLVITVVGVGERQAAAGPVSIRCDALSTAELDIDGLLEDWATRVLARAGSAPAGAIELRCAWDGEALALALDVRDDRVVRVRGKGPEDRVEIAVAAGARRLAIAAAPGTAIARARITAPARVAVADSLQPHGFSIEARIPAAAIPGLSASTPALELAVTFHDADQAAAGGTEHTIELSATIALGDREDLLADFLRATRLAKAEIRLDVLAELDPDRKGKERLVAGGGVIGVLTDRFAFVTLPVTRPADVQRVEVLALGPRGQDVVSAVVRQTGNGGSRDLLLLWTVWSGQLQPLAQIEVRKQQGGNSLEASWKLVRGRRGPELWVEPRPAVGWTAETWNEVPADDADPIVLPWDARRGGIAYALTGAEIQRRDLPPPRRR